MPYLTTRDGVDLFYKDWGEAQLLKNGTLKTYKGFPHGMPTQKPSTPICWLSSRASCKRIGLGRADAAIP